MLHYDTSAPRFAGVLACLLTSREGDALALYFGGVQAAFFAACKKKRNACWECRVVYGTTLVYCGLPELEDEGRGRADLGAFIY